MVGKCVARVSHHRGEKQQEHDRHRREGEEAHKARRKQESSVAYRAGGLRATGAAVDELRSRPLVDGAIFDGYLTTAAQ